MKLLFLILICANVLHAEYQYIFDKDKQCSVYDEIEKDAKNVELFWSGECKDKKAQGHGIAILSKDVNGTRVPFFRYEGKIVDGKYEGEAFVKWYLTNDKGSVHFKNSFLDGEAFLLVNDGAILLHDRYEKGKMVKKFRVVKSEKTEGGYDAFRKVRKSAFQYETLLQNKLLKSCEYDEHTLKARKYDMHRLSALTFRTLITCYSENKRYEEALNLYNEALKYPKADNKFFIKLLYRPLAFAYYGVGKYEESFKHLEKLSNNSVTKETLVLLKSKNFTPFDSKRKKLLKKFSNFANNDMLKAIRSSNIENLHKALKSGADVNWLNKKGETPLIVAGYYDNVEIVKALLNAGANINAQSNEGSTVLMNASYSGNLDVVKILIKNGANVNIMKNGSDYTALLYALENNHISIVKILLKQKPKQKFFKRTKLDNYIGKCDEDKNNQLTTASELMCANVEYGRKLDEDIKKIRKIKELLGGK